MSFSFESFYVGLSVISATCSGMASLVLVYIFKDKNHREQDIDCFLPTVFYICLCNLIWNISSSLFGFISVSDNNYVKCTLESTVNTLFLKASLLWSTALLFQIQVLVLRHEPVGAMTHYNDDYYREVKKSKRFPRTILHVFIWLIASITTMLPMIVTQNVHTNIYGPFGTDENTWCFLRNNSPVWIISTFNSVLFICLIASIIMFFYIHCQITISSTSPSVYHMYQGFKLYSIACFICFGPMLAYLSVINIGNLAGTYSNDSLTYYFNIVTMIMQCYGIVFPLCVTLMSTQWCRPFLKLLCCRCRAHDPTSDNLQFEDEEYSEHSVGSMLTGSARMERNDTDVGFTGPGHNNQRYNNGSTSARSLKITPASEQQSQTPQSSCTGASSAAAGDGGLLAIGGTEAIMQNQRQQQFPPPPPSSCDDGYSSDEVKRPPLLDPTYVYRGGGGDDNDGPELSSAELAAIKIQKQWEMLLAGGSGGGDRDEDTHRKKGHSDDDEDDDDDDSSSDGQDNAQLSIWSSQAAVPPPPPPLKTKHDQEVAHTGYNNDHDNELVFPHIDSNSSLSTKRLTFFEKQRLEEQGAKQRKEQELNAMNSSRRVALDQETEQQRQHESAKSKHYEKMGSTFKAGGGSDLLSSGANRRRSSKARPNPSHSLRSSIGAAAGRGGASSSKKSSSAAAALHYSTYYS